MVLVAGTDGGYWKEEERRWIMVEFREARLVRLGSANGILAKTMKMGTPRYLARPTNHLTQTLNFQLLQSSLSFPT